MTSHSVLISGAGVAGATLAYWLARNCSSVTVVEKDVGTRSSGNPVDIRGQALEITDAMGVLPRLRDNATRPHDSLLVDDHDHPIARLATQNTPRRGGEPAEVELSRSVLAEALLDCCPDDVDIRFDDSIVRLAQDPDGVDVSLESGQERRFDLVVGADGVHSRTRRLIFGEEQQFSRRLGLSVVTVPMPDLTEVPDEVRIFNAPGRMVTIHPARDVPGAAFIFRHRWPPDLDGRDLDQVRQLVASRYAGLGWRVPELLSRMSAADDVWADAVVRLTVHRWWSGRVGLVGDAASSVSLFGDGSTKAIIGAHLLAAELAGTDDHEAAFGRYQDKHRRAISSPMEVGLAAALLVPKSAPGMTIRNGALRVLDVGKRSFDRLRTRSQ